MNSWFDIQMKAGDAEILIYDAIGRSFFEDTLTAKDFVNQFNAVLAKNPKNISIRINSPGGSVADGTAIFNAINRVRDRVVCYVDGWAASIASIIALAGSKTVMGKNAVMMIHNPVGGVRGDSKDLRKMADFLDQAKSMLVNIYKEKTGKPEDEISSKMDDETWFTAEMAKEFGLADEIEDGVGVAAHFDPMAFSNVFVYCEAFASNAQPKQIREELSMDSEKTPATLQEIESACKGADPTFLLGQIKAGVTKEEALQNWIDEQSRRLQEVESKMKELQQTKPGVPPVPDTATNSTGESVGVDAERDWNEAVIQNTKCGMPIAQAVSVADRDNPGLRKAYLEAYNARHGRLVNIRD